MEKIKSDQTSDGLNQIFEIINAKGDKGEIDNILDKSANHKEQVNDEQAKS